MNSFFIRGSMPSGVLPGTICGASFANRPYSSAACSGAPEMISGVRASSIRMLSTSSMIPNVWYWDLPSSGLGRPPCWTFSSSVVAMLSRR